MSAPRTIAGPLNGLGQDHTKWRPNAVAPLPLWEGPWNRIISLADVDAERTKRLVDVDVAIDVLAGNDPHQGSSYGMPVTRFDSKSEQTTTVWDLSRPVEWRWFQPPIVPTHQIPLPPIVLREGDPAGAFDRHAYLWDEPAKVLIEMISVDDSLMARVNTLGQAGWTVGYPGGGPGLVRWDMTRPYDPKARNPRGVVAAGVPQLPMVFGWEDVLRGEALACMFLVLPNYGSGFTGWAVGGDGNQPGHPCRGGELLRLTAEAHAALCMLHPAGSPARAIVNTLRKRGALVGDRKGPSSGDARASLALTQDRRFAKGEGDIPPLAAGLTLRLSMFEVVAA